MAEWEPGPDPFPAGKVRKVTDIRYIGELKFVRHAKMHLKKKPE